MNPLRNMMPDQRKMLLTFIVAGVGALFAEHLLRPQLKGKLKI